MCGLQLMECVYSWKSSQPNVRFVLNQSYLVFMWIWMCNYTLNPYCKIVVPILFSYFFYTPSIWWIPSSKFVTEIQQSSLVFISNTVWFSLSSCTSVFGLGGTKSVQIWHIKLCLNLFRLKDPGMTNTRLFSWILGTNWHTHQITATSWGVWSKTTINSLW